MITLYLLFVVVSATAGGTAPSLVAALAGFLAVNWYCTPPIHTWTVAEGEDVVALLWALATALLGLVQNLLQFVVARVVSGLGTSHALPVHGSMLADAYPEEARLPAFFSNLESGRVIADGTPHEVRHAPR